MPIVTLKTNDLEDLYLPDGRNLSLISDQTACVQSVRQATKMRLAENIFNISQGVRYLESIFSPQPDFDAARKSLSDAILSVPDVLSIEALTINVNGNSFVFDAQILTVYGQVALNNTANQQD
ncbi:hypothetical protein [Xanthomonas phage Carpasina]|uniref:DUF2634 domain-containing protein n=3 Tax=Carpasinavirus TaxID=2733099 RepID=A0A858NNL7_9CAUD|nr:hypothetical protein HOT16_gp19 [Xanthomonas phage Carpasina]AWD92414.1 hypothetical protein [Xanthomonas phage Carpasina]QJB22079.1 hypothetical protein XccvBFoX6_gp21 [Xanthomonas phage FoX6]QJB22178.1 hypothetical protein XccvBFoX7_gp21 [Xanthomonas phage FoX7]